MKLLILILFPYILFSQSYKIYDPLRENSLIQNIDFTQIVNNELVDKSGNDNNLQLVNSSCIKLTSQYHYVTYPEIAGFGTRNFTIELYIDHSQFVSGGAVLLGGTGTGGEGLVYIRTLNTAVRYLVFTEKTTGTTTGVISIGAFPNYMFKFKMKVRLGEANAVSVYFNDTLKGNYCDLTNITDVSFTGGFNIGNPPGSVSPAYYAGFKIMNYNEDTVYLESPLSEGNGSVAYDVSGNDRHGTVTGTAGVATYVRTNNVYHYNLIRGFQLYEDTTNLNTVAGYDIRVPLKRDGSKLSPSIARWKMQDTYYAGHWWNYCETQFKQKTAFLQYDTLNYFFNTDSSAKTLSFGELNDITVTNIVGSDSMNKYVVSSNFHNKFYCDNHDSLRVTRFICFSKEVENQYISRNMNEVTADIWLLFGQSNTAGRSPIYIYQDGKKVHRKTHIYVSDRDCFYNMNASFESNNLSGYTATDTTVGGVEIMLGDKIKYKRNEPYFIKKTAGGTPLYQCGGDTLDWNVNSTNELLDQLYVLIDSGISVLNEKTIKYRFAGIIWCQGEGDASALRSAAYQQNEADLFDSLRAYINTPECPIYSYSTYDYLPPYSTTVRQAKLNNAGIISNYNYIESNGFSGDEIHLYSLGYRQFTNAILEILNP